MNHHLAKVSGVILAAGQASRMGRDKLSLPFKGLPLLHQVVDAARNSTLTEVIVVLPEDSELRRTVDLSGCTVVTSVDRDKGQAESLKAGLHAIDETAAGCMVLLGDQPLLTTETIDMLVGAFAQQPECWVAPVQEGMRGNPITIPCDWFPKVFELEGDTGARPILGSPGLALRLVRIHEVGPFIDVDTEHHYQRLLAKYDTKPA
ncbi:NTP transferase domain-containing protein [Pseudodesulfovibrio sp. JC047]|uniref:nucleotidyltransferase family protein n=1 Tax=Pseudodesulfovibrio sp. JC047 TaxID=2683199 RepID=UPI0013D57629|nr:nucleotidyltransferase family protein [Pseudodesulfovibrio sp. JC047]NDV18345.1 NTP transferase domain-containing protein [Pseudodesulfovibrio sp. JC047]